MNRKRIAIIGGGSLGLYTAKLLAKTNLDIFLFEKNNKLGKKILASGNGKCNLTNENIDASMYNNEFAISIINKYNNETTLKQFKEWGLIYKKDDKGRYYPVSENSNSVLDVLKEGLKNIHILVDSEVKDIQKEGNNYLVSYNNKKEIFDFVICSSGSSASNLGSPKAYKYLENLKLKMISLSSSLTPVVVEENVQTLKGVRVKGIIKLKDEKDNIIYKEDGEIIFKDDSLSGIAVFNASSYINRKKQNYTISLDLSNGLKKEEMLEYFDKKNAANIFKGFLNDKLAQYILDNSNIKSNILTINQKEKLYEKVTNLSFKVKSLYPLKEGQVCSGGISLEEINENLELKRYPCIYVGGELIDIDGVSGGYNLQFAWSSAGVIVQDILKKTGEKSGS